MTCVKSTSNSSFSISRSKSDWNVRPPKGRLDLRPVDKPFVNKGKVRDFRDTGIPGINNEELDPENQRRALENFGFLKGEDPEMQQAMVKTLSRIVSSRTSSLSLGPSLNLQTLIETISAILPQMLVEDRRAMVKRSPSPHRLQALRSRNLWAPAMANPSRRALRY